MSEFNPYLLITPAVMLFIGIALLFAWSFDRQERAPFWMAIGVISTGIPLGIQSLLPVALIAQYAVWTAVLYLAGAWCIGYSIAVKFKAPYGHRYAVPIAIMCLLGIYYFSRVQESLAIRAAILSAGLGLLQMLPLTRALRYRPQGDMFDASLYWSYIAFCIYTALRPVAFMLFEQLLRQDLVNTVYWFVTLLSSILFCMTFSFLLLGSCIRSRIRKLHAERDLDPLTNLMNRRAFDESVLQMKGAGEVAVVLADVDHFKQINDQYGHDVGDEVLRQLGQCLRQASRVGDLVARLGGEEFVLLLPQTDSATAQVFAQRLQALLAQGCCTLPDKRRVTMSFGVASLQGGPMHEAIKRADVALYRAKEAGRNRICVDGQTGGADVSVVGL